jgi:hypothetical protein
MFLINRLRTVAHGDDDYYKFDSYVPVGVVGTQEEAERYIAAVEAKYQAAVEAHRQGLSDCKRAWKDANPKPLFSPLITVPKWGVVKNADITPEMRAERERIREQNNQIHRHNHRADLEWYRRFKAVEDAYLEANKPPKRQQLSFQEVPQLVVEEV